MKKTRLFLLTLLLTMTGVLGMSAQEAYRALKLEQTSDGHQGLTITYYYDNQRSSRGNTVDAILNVDGLLDGFTDVDDYVDDVNIVFDSSFANYFPTSTMYWFSAVPAKRKVTFYGWQNLNTSEVTSMLGMFESLGHYFDKTIGHQVSIVVENFSLSYFDTSKVSEMDNMFANVCLDELDISHFTFKPGVTTNMLLASSTIKDLYIPAAAVDWADEACQYMNGGDGPCTLHYPNSINPRATYLDNEVVNGDCESNNTTCLIGHDGDPGSSDATNFVNGAGYNGSRAVKVHASANATYDYDAMFFVYTPNHTWQAGDHYRFKMKVRADKASYIYSQSHLAPHEYIHYSMLGGSNYDVGTEWREIEYEGTISTQQVGAEGLKTIAFVINGKKENINFYFDDISWEPIEMGSPTSFGWKGGIFKDVPGKNSYAVLSNNLRTLTLYDDDNKLTHEGEGLIFNTKMDSGNPEWYAYSGAVTNVVIDGSVSATAANSLPNQLFINMGTADNPCQLTCPDGIITSPYFANGESKSEGLEIQTCENTIVASDGSNVNDAKIVEIDGNKCYTAFSAEDVNEDENAYWNSQFFVTTPNHDWKAGDRYRFKMKVRADKPAEIQVQAHIMPGGYQHWIMLGGKYNVSTEWQEFVYEGIITAEQAGNGAMHTITFLPYVQKEENNYYFDDISWEPIFTNSNGEDYFIWKGGHFLIPSKPETYAVLSTDKTTLTVYYGDDKKSHAKEGTFYRVYSGDSQGWSEYSSLITKVDLDPSFTNTPSSTTQLPYNYFSGLGTATPCLLYYPSDYTLDGTTQETGYFIWRDGHFKTPTAYAVLSSDKKTLTFYCDDKRSSHSSPEATFNMIDSYGKPGWQINQNVNKSIIKTVAFDESFSHYHPTTCFFWFADMYNLTNIQHLDYLKTDKVKAFVSMFNTCRSLKEIDISHFTDISVDNGVNSMFNYCESLEHLDISHFAFNGNNNAAMLGNCISLKTLTVSASANKLPDNAFRSLASASSPCELILTENFILEGATYGEDYILWKGGYFKIHCDAYAQIDGDIMAFYYDNQYGKRSGTAYILDLDEAYDLPNWHHAPGTEAITKVIFDSSFKKAKPKNCRGWFYDFTNLTTIKDIENLNTSKVVNMNTMFLFCGNLTALDLSGFDTSNVTDMSYMFDGCYSMTTLSGINFDTSNVTDMSYMFSICSALTSLDVSHFDTSNVTDMSSMFAYCYELRNLDLSNFYFDENANTEDMLYFCQQLKALTIPESAKHWNDGACNGVGSQNQPCALFYPDGFTPEKSSTGDGWYRWKNGYFADAIFGDANGDRAVTVADVMLTVNKVLGRELSTFNPKAADVNKDGVITVSDVMGIVNIVLSGGRASAPRNAYQTMSDAMGMTAKGNELTLHLRGTGSYTASQMIITLPEGCRLENAQMVSSRSNGHSVQTSDLGNGRYRVVVYGASGLPFGSSCTDLVRLNVKGNHNGDVAVSDIQVVDYHTNTMLLSDVSGLATGIESISTDTSDDGDWYTTQGQRVTTPTRGIYIRNGQKKTFKD